MITPIGIAWRNGFVRCCSDCFDKPYLIERMKASSNNIVPVIVIDINTKKAKCYMINDTITDFDEITVNEPVLCRRIEVIADYMINKKNIQKSNLTINEKEESGIMIEKRDYSKQTLTGLERARLTSLQSKVNIPDV